MIRDIIQNSFLLNIFADDFYNNNVEHKKLKILKTF